MRECPRQSLSAALASTLATESMDHAVNEFGQPIGFPLPDWRPPPHPPREPMVGRYCRLEPLQPAIHAAALYEAYAGNDSGWTYLSCGPFRSFESYRDWTDSVLAADDPLFFAILHQGQAGRRGQLHADHAVGRFDRGRSCQFLAGAEAVSGCHRGHVSDDGNGVPTGLPPLRVEMRRPERSFACGGPATRILLRGYDSPGDGLQGSQPRYGVVFDHRHRMACSSWSVRGVARSGQLRFGRPATQSVV